METSLLKNSKWLFILLVQACLLFSYGQTGTGKAGVDKSQFLGIALTVDISKEISLAILLAKDGTINRKGNGIVDSTDKTFFIGRTQEKIFDNLMQTVSEDLLSYCGQPSPVCDTTKQTYKVTVSFSGERIDTGFEYCINGTADDLPKPIKEYIANAIKVTEPWYQQQKNRIDKK